VHSFLEKTRRLDGQVDASTKVNEILVGLVCNLNGTFLLHFLLVF
jgi:hypothetical protein